MFSADYDPTLQWAIDFLGNFLSEISQPPRSREDLLEYVPTQVLAELIRAQGYQGIAYTSAQHPGGVNYTLFCSPEPDPALPFTPNRPVFRDWLRIENVTTVKIKGLTLDAENADSRDIAEADLKGPNQSHKANQS